MTRIGHRFFADEGNLNLMTASEVRAAARVENFEAEVSSVALAGWPSNILLCLRRQDAQRNPPATRHG